MSNLVAVAREVQGSHLIMARFFEKPRCKPWDIVKGRRFVCCHGLGEHTRWCLRGVETLGIPQFKEISPKELIDA